MVKGYGVSVQELREHAQTVDNEVMARLKKAAEAAKQVKFGGTEAYGILLQAIIPPVIEACVGDAEKGLDSFSKLGDTVTEAVRTAAQTYEDVDNTMADLLKKFEDAGIFRW